MSDLIKRADAIKALHEEWDGGWLEATGEWVADNCEAVLNRLSPAEITADDVLEYCRPRLLTIVAEEALPSADRPQGEWIDMGDFEKCSVCKGTRLKEFQSYYGKVTWIKTPYCPHCGARMKGADDD